VPVAVVGPKRRSGACHVSMTVHDSRILDGLKMKFASRKRLNQQKKAEKQFSPGMPIHCQKNRRSLLTQIVEKKGKWCARWDSNP
jgi:hypothetical protein